MVNLKVDSETKNIELEVMLKGEDKPLSLKISDYKIVRDNGATFIDISNVESNREWINLMFDSFFKNRQIEIPQQYAPLLDIAL